MFQASAVSSAIFVESVIRDQSYKTFYVRNARNFVLSWIVCENRLERLVKDKHSSLLQVFEKYGQKSFITLGPGVFARAFLTTKRHNIHNINNNSIMETVQVKMMSQLFSL
jgi:hypothetical protein